MSRWLWLGGWGLSPEAQRDAAQARWPEVEHTVFAPSPGGLAALRETLLADGADRLLGYSLGSLLLLREPELLSCAPTWLFAPILDFKAETGRGGRFQATHLNVLLRFLRRDPLGALTDFTERADLHTGAASGELPYAAEDLIWGIGQLRDQIAEPPSASLPVRAWIGAQDALLDAGALRDQWPEVTVLPGAGHDLSDLLKEVSA